VDVRVNMTDNAMFKVLEQFSRSSERVTFILKDGRRFEGWIEEIKEGRVLLSWAPSPFYAQAVGSDESDIPDEWIMLSEIDRNTIK